MPRQAKRAVRARKQTAVSDAQRHSIRVTEKKISILKKEIAQCFDANGYLSYSARKKKFTILGTSIAVDGLVECPECGLGQLMVIRSHTTKKRFMGCSNYYGGCTASSPLLQKARLRATKQPCGTCGWPLIIFRYSRNQTWTKQCSNIRCPSRDAAKT